LRASKNKENTFYYLALLDWAGIILSQDDMKSFTKEIITSTSVLTNSWTIESLLLPNLKDDISNLTIGYYHSRLIFKGTLPSVPTDIFGIRELRIKLENEINDFLYSNIIPRMAKYTKNPRVFTYPVFEIQSHEFFWKFEREKTYSLPPLVFTLNWMTLDLDG
jgi:hypothetical protein